jgi:hypothetical protein
MLKALACSRRGAPAPGPLAELAARLASAALSVHLSSPLRRCDDPLLRSLSLPAAAPPPQSDAEGEGGADELALLAALGAHSAAADDDSTADVAVRAVVVCAQTVGALLNKHAVEAGGAEAIAAVARIINNECGLISGPATSATPPAPLSAPAPALSLPSPTIQRAAPFELRQRGVLLAVWAAKGLAMRAHPAAAGFVDSLTALLARDTNATLATLAGAGLGLLPQDSPPAFPLHRLAGAVGSQLFKQRVFESLMAMSSATGAGVAEGRAPLLLCLCAMSVQLPPAVVQGHLERMLPLVLRGLELASASAPTLAAPAPVTSPAPAPPAGPEVAPGADELRSALALAALSALRALVARSAASVAASPHFAGLVGQLLVFARLQPCSSRALARATAVECLRDFAAPAASVPFFRLKTVKASVLAGLLPALDDPKRAVRRRAQAARGAWATLVS